MANLAKPLDESLVNFFDEELVSLADLSFRFAFGLTMSLDGAKRIVLKTYETLAADLETFAAGSRKLGAAFIIVQQTWNAYQALKGQKFTTGATAVTRALKTLDFEPRAAILAVDVAGLQPADAARALAWTEGDLRRNLAVARRSLTNGPLIL